MTSLPFHDRPSSHQCRAGSPADLSKLERTCVLTFVGSSPPRPSGSGAPWRPARPFPASPRRETLSSFCAFSTMRGSVVDAVHVGIDVAALRAQRRRQRHRRGVRNRRAPASSPGLRADALEAGDHRDDAPGRSVRRSSTPISTIEAEPCTPSVRIGTRHPAHERRHPDRVERDGGEPGGHVLAGRGDGVVSARRRSGDISRVKAPACWFRPTSPKPRRRRRSPDRPGVLTSRATARMRSTPATEVPPNFITRRGFIRGGHRRLRRAFPGAEAAWRYRPHPGGNIKQAVGAAGGLAHRRHDRRPPTARQDGASTVDAADVARFSAIAAEWWTRPASSARCTFQPGAPSPISARGPRPLRPRRRRAAAVRGCACSTSAAAAAFSASRWPASASRSPGPVASGRNIGTASATPPSRASPSTYWVTTAEALAAAGERFDVILNMEVVEARRRPQTVHGQLRRHAEARRHDGGGDHQPHDEGLGAGHHRGRRIRCWAGCRAAPTTGRNSSPRRTQGGANRIGPRNGWS